MELLDIFPLKIVRSLALLSFIGFPKSEASTRVLFNYLSKSGVSSFFLVEGPSEDGNRSLTLALSLDALDRCQAELEALREIMQAQAVIVEKPVAIIRILGPHFDIRPGIAGFLFGKLARSDIELLANSTTITSSLLVVREEEVEQAVRVISSIFRLPQSK
jgi:aspartokinase